MTLSEDNCEIKYGVDFLFNHQHKAFRIPIEKKQILNNFLPVIFNGHKEFI